MSTKDMQISVSIGMGVLLATAIAIVIIKRNEDRDLWRVWPDNGSAFKATLAHTPPQVRIFPTKFADRRGSYSGGVGGKLLGFNESIAGIAKIACASPGDYNWDSSRTLVSPDLPQGRYDFIANLRDGAGPALEKEMESKFGIVAEKETRNRDVLLLTVVNANAPALKPGAAEATSSRYSEKLPDGEVSFINYKMSDLAVELERTLNVPVVDGSGLSGRFNFNIEWKQNDADGLKQILQSQLGLALVSTNMPIEVLVVKKKDEPI